MLLAVLGFFGDRASQNKSQGGVVVAAVVVADIHTDPEKGSVGGAVVLAVEREEEAPVSSIVPCLGSTCLDLDCVFDEGE